jgi:carbonic anhydrase
MISAKDALDHLREGNRRFASGKPILNTEWRHPRPTDLTAGQRPLAIILSCSDSRVPPEILFDQGLGALFVVRVAGNIAGPTQVGSIQYAAEHLGTRLIMVLGHSQCGAVQATLKHLNEYADHISRELRSIVDSIRPTVEPLLKTEAVRDGDALLQQAVRRNTFHWVNHLRHNQVLANLIRDDDLLVIGAEYSLDTRRVEFFDETI